MNERAAGRSATVSVIIPAYNTADYIADTLASVLAQKSPELEVLVVDDGSSDRTGDVVKGFADPRVLYFHRENSGGPAAPRNLGVRKARGEYVCFFDSDDLMAPGKIARQIAFMQERSLGMSATNFRKFFHRPEEAGENYLDHYPRFLELRRRLGKAPAMVIPSAEAFNLLLYENFIGTSSVVVRREILEAAGPFDESLQSADDLDMWFRIARLGWDIGFLDMVGHYYRIRNNGISMSSRKKVLLNRIEVMRKQLSAPTTRRQRRQVRHLMAEYWLGLGYHYKDEGNFSRARDSFVLSFMTDSTLKALLALAAIWFPGRRRDSLPAIKAPVRSESSQTRSTP